jgi:hypothetical protein
MKKFKYKDTEFNIVNQYDTQGHESWQEGQLMETDRTIIKNIFPLIPIWKNKKFRWFKNCKARYRLCFTRTKEFDDGWTYKEYYTPWVHTFVLDEIID